MGYRRMYIPLEWVIRMMGSLCGLLLVLLLEVQSRSLSLDRSGVGYKMRDLLRDRRVSYGIVRFYPKYLIVSLLSA